VRELAVIARPVDGPAARRFPRAMLVQWRAHVRCVHSPVVVGRVSRRPCHSLHAGTATGGRQRRLR
jgi:hypothetical protein